MKKQRRADKKRVVGFADTKQEDGSPSRSVSPTRGRTSPGFDEEEKGAKSPGGDSESSDDDEGDGITLKGAAQYMQAY